MAGNDRAQQLSLWQRTCGRVSSHHSRPGSRESASGNRLTVNLHGPNTRTLFLLCIWMSEFKSRFYHLLCLWISQIISLFSYCWLWSCHSNSKQHIKASLHKATETVIIIFIAVTLLLASHSIALSIFQYGFFSLDFCFFIYIWSLL